MLGPGDPAPWLTATLKDRAERYQFDRAAGRHVLLLFYGRARIPASISALAAVLARRDLFDDIKASFFGVSNDPADAANDAIAASPGVAHILDFDGRFAHAYGLISAGDGGKAVLTPRWILLDPELRICAVFPIERAEAALAALEAGIGATTQRFAPVLLIDHVFEPDFCQALIDSFPADGGERSGFMNGGAERHDTGVKQRRDWHVLDGNLKAHMAQRMRRCLVPALQRHFNYAATHLERYMVARYDAGAGYFKPHRDSVTAAYAHRKFALTINLNDDYVGGELTFAEFGNQAFHTPRGTAILFSGALLHEVTPVEQGTRFAFLSFLFDGAANKGLEAQHPEWPKGTAGDLSEPR